MQLPLSRTIPSTYLLVNVASALRYAVICLAHNGLIATHVCALIVPLAQIHSDSSIARNLPCASFLFVPQGSVGTITTYVPHPLQFATAHAHPWVQVTPTAYTLNLTRCVVRAYASHTVVREHAIIPPSGFRV